MPIYEFRCEACDARFEELMAAGDEGATCPHCGSGRLSRAYSAPAAPLRIVRSPGSARRQEARNEALRESTKASFKQRRRRAREARKAARGDG